MLNVDIDILNRCRAVTPAGELQKILYSRQVRFEVDNNKVYTLLLYNTK